MTTTRTPFPTKKLLLLSVLFGVGLTIDMWALSLVQYSGNIPIGFQYTVSRIVAIFEAPVSLIDPGPIQGDSSQEAIFVAVLLFLAFFWSAVTFPLLLIWTIIKRSAEGRRTGST
jgi:hypothetical protein